MSAIKDPSEKKRLSLERDRRNTYGENSKSSRKNIRRGKQRQHMDERRKTNALLARLTEPVNEDHATKIEVLAKSEAAESRWRGFKKEPDTPLGVVLEKKHKRRSVLKKQAK